MTLIMLPLIMAIDIFWKRFALALLFPLAMMVLVPISFSNSRPAGPQEPNVSCAMGIKWLSLALYRWSYCGSDDLKRSGERRVFRRARPELHSK